MSYFTDINLNKPLTGYGELQIAPATPWIQVSTPYGLNPDHLVPTNSGVGSGVSWSNGLTTVSSGTANNGTAQIKTKQVIRYGPGQATDTRYSAIFSAPDALNMMVVGLGDDQDGFFFGFNGVQFGINRRKFGVDHWVAQSAWNVDQMDGSGPSGMLLDTTKGNLYRITYQWFGFGMIVFMIEVTSTGAYQIVHRIAYAGVNTETSISNPTFSFLMKSTNSASGTTNCAISTASISAFTQGTIDNQPFTRFASGATRLNITAERNVISLRNKATNVLGGVNTNRSVIQIDWISAARLQTQPIIIRALENTVLGGVPIFTDVDTSRSLAQIDVAGSTITGGIERWSSVLAGTSDMAVPIELLKLLLFPGDTITFTASATASTDVWIRVGWRELQ